MSIFKTQVAAGQYLQAFLETMATYTTMMKNDIRYHALSRNNFLPFFLESVKYSPSKPVQHEYRGWLTVEGTLDVCGKRDIIP